MHWSINFSATLVMHAIVVRSQLLGAGEPREEFG